MSSAEQSMAELQQAIADYPRRVAELSGRVAAAAADTVTGTDLGSLVTVTATGAGQITSVRVSATALRDLDTHSLAQRVTEAANAALANAEAALTAATGFADDSGVEQRLAAFEQRLDQTLDDLDRVERNLDRLS